ncbi:MAG: right-handed parallel beta-helix repeat-containing protein [Gemmatimonadales bacterium]|nr:right-handed parallel beta-helix repeat-containing protein [Gemmatimonadales bacterium]
MRQFLPVIVFLLLNSPVLARTWYVEKDDSGDFSVIQEAVDAAASQDTIRIGPGHFDEWTFIGPLWDERYVQVLVSQSELTFIGSGSAQTIIGQGIPWELEQGNHQGILTEESCNTLHVQDIGFQNLKVGIFAGTGNRSTFLRCHFWGNDSSLALGTKISVVEKCEFHGTLQGGFSIISYFQEEIRIFDCLSESDVQWQNKHIQVEGPSRIYIDQCEFRGAAGGITLSRGPRAEISFCKFENQTNYGINLCTGAPSCTITDCSFRDQMRVFLDSTRPGAEWKIERIIVENVSRATMVGEYLDNGYIRDSVLAKGDRGVVSSYSFGKNQATSSEDSSTLFDMRNNWWGTTDPDSIRAWILDFNDDSRIKFEIEFEPFKKHPYATEIDIDIKPESDTNPINCKLPMKGTVPVAVLGSDEFDVSTLDPATVRFGPEDAIAVNYSDRGQVRHSLDINRDGYLDLMFHFRLAETGIRCDDTGVTLTGETFDGEPVLGTDVIRTVPKSGIDPASDKVVEISPNPFNPMALVSFKVDQSQRVGVSVYDMRGRLVADLIHQQFGVGEHTVVWKGQDSAGLEVPSGAYFFRVEMGDRVETQKALLLR